MDALVELLPLLFIGLYYLLTARRRSQKAKAAQARAEAPQTELVSDEPRAPTPFQAFLDQLEAAAAEAAGAVEPPTSAEALTLEAATEVPPSPPIPESRLEAVPQEFTAIEGSFDSFAPSDHEAHGFGRENPLSEELFESAPAFVEPRRRRERRYDPHGLQRPVPNELGPDWRRSLRDPKAAREAFVLQTIFGKRGGRKSENR